jgi:hypothetical protein
VYLFLEWVGRLSPDESEKTNARQVRKWKFKKHQEKGTYFLN